MKFSNKFIFNKEADAKKFIKDMSDLYYNIEIMVGYAFMHLLLNHIQL